MIQMLTYRFSKNRPEHYNFSYFLFRYVGTILRVLLDSVFDGLFHSLSLSFCIVYNVSTFLLCLTTLLVPYRSTKLDPVCSLLLSSVVLFKRNSEVACSTLAEGE